MMKNPSLSIFQHTQSTIRILFLATPIHLTGRRENRKGQRCPKTSLSIQLDGLTGIMEATNPRQVHKKVHLFKTTVYNLAQEGFGTTELKGQVAKPAATKLEVEGDLLPNLITKSKAQEQLLEIRWAEYRLQQQQRTKDKRQAQFIQHPCSDFTDFTKTILGQQKTVSLLNGGTVE